MMGLRGGFRSAVHGATGRGRRRRGLGWTIATIVLLLLAAAFVLRRTGTF
jgi:hypothetical protein